ncbi:MAG: diaminopimelate decarboxylase [Candidatus Sumerlaeales bacterium]|nr:diaminopimelate decarboxylase [Candidatus Sumerlaeales bacterium]
MSNYQTEELETLACKVGTPYWIIDAELLRKRIGDLKEIAALSGVHLRYAMKALSCTRVLEEMRKAGLWVDCVSGNEVLRALKAGFPSGTNPPVIQLTADVFRDSALRAVTDNNVIVNIGSAGMISALKAAGWQGPVAVRVNPGFGHGHVSACDTGGPSSKHGIWPNDLPDVIRACHEARFKIVMLHAHVGTGAEPTEFFTNMRRLGEYFASLISLLPDVRIFSLGGGLPYNYHEDQPDVDYSVLIPTLQKVKTILSSAVGSEIQLELEPGRYFVAPAVTLVTRVTDVKKTTTNAKGPGQTFVMVDAGFVDLVRPAMYGSYHAISIPAREGMTKIPLNVAGPLCESGDVFTRDQYELLAPRLLPLPQINDLLLLHDVGAYGYSMSSNYNSIGRAPILWKDSDRVTMIVRRETVDDLLRTECNEEVSLL